MYKTSGREAGCFELLEAVARVELWRRLIEDDEPCTAVLQISVVLIAMPWQHMEALIKRRGGEASFGSHLPGLLDYSFECNHYR